MLVGLEVGLAVVLLVGGGLMVNTMVRLLRVDSGYRAGSALTMRVQLPRGRTPPDRIEAVRGAHACGRPASAGRLNRRRQRRRAAAADILYAGHYRVEGFSAEWMAEGASSGGGPCCTQTQWVSPRYFEATGIQVLRGRPFSPADAEAAPPVALIGERLARKFPAGIDAIGHHLTADADASDRRTIVGVVRDVRDMALERQPLQAIYLPIEERGAAALTLVLKTSVDPMSIAANVRDAVQRQAGPVVITDVLTLDDVIARSVGARRLNAWLFGAFGVLGLLLTAIGIGGVISYAVARRTREIGVRLALGATPSQVRGLVVRTSLAPVAAGLVAGLAVALGLSRYAASLLYEVTPRDAWTVHRSLSHGRPHRGGRRVSASAAGGFRRSHPRAARRIARSREP